MEKAQPTQKFTYVKELEDVNKKLNDEMIKKNSILLQLQSHLNNEFKLTRDNVSLFSHNESLLNTNLKLKNENEKLNLQLQSFSNKNGENEKLILQLQKEKDLLLNRFNGLQYQLNKITNEKKTMEKQKKTSNDNTNNLNEEHQQILNDLNTKITQLESEKMNYGKELSQLQNEIQNIQIENNKAQKDIQNANDEISKHKENTDLYPVAHCP